MAASEPSLDALLRRLAELSGVGVEHDVAGAVTLVIEQIAEKMAARDLSEDAFEELHLGVTPLHPDDPASGSDVLVTATGLNLDGDPEPLAFAVGDEGDVTVLCGEILQDLHARGLRDVGRVLSIADPAVRNRLPWVLPGARWDEMAAGETPDWLAVPDGPDH